MWYQLKNEIMTKLKKGLFGLVILASGVIAASSGGGSAGDCWVCDGSGKNDCIYCSNGYGDDGRTCTFCNGTGNSN